MACLLATPGAQAQTPAPVAGDCLGAIYIKDSIYVCDRPGRGFGNILEVKENAPSDPRWLEREHHSTWYMFRVPVQTTLTFDIIPKNPDDDIDFLLFDGNLPNLCGKIQTKEAEPVRSNISRNDKSLASRCGLSKDAADEFVHSGVGSSYSKAIDTGAGQLFYLLVDYQDRPLDGYVIHFHYDPPPPVAEPLPQKLHIDLVDGATGGPVDAALTIEGMRFDSVVEAKGGSQYDFMMDTYRRLRISCLRKGYMFHSEKVVTGGDAEVRVTIRLTPIEPGAQVVLDDIHFVGNEDKVMRSSEASLYLLLHFLQQNPAVKVEVQGHVNGPSYKKNSKEFIALSESRARTVYNFLIVNDVEPARLSYVGMGNAHMLFPDPKNRAESEANRRVEIKVTGT